MDQLRQPSDTASSDADAFPTGKPSDWGRQSTEFSASATLETAPILAAPQNSKKFDSLHAGYRSYRQLCEQIISELSKADAFLDGDRLTDEGDEVVVEVEYLLELLDACPWGEEEALQRIVTSIQSQILNTRWTRRHIQFMTAVFRYLQSQYRIAPDTVRKCNAFLNEHGLNQFRGTFSSESTLKTYEIVETKRESK